MKALKKARRQGRKGKGKGKGKGNVGVSRTQCKI